MAARIRKIRHDENTRAKIKVSQLVNRLQDHIDGTIKLAPSQITAAIALLDRVLPKMAAVEHSGELQRTVVVRAPAVSQSSEDWSKQYAPVSRDVGTNGKPDVTH